MKSNNMKTGKKRDIIDQFYTNRDVSSKCIKILQDTLNFKIHETTKPNSNMTVSQLKHYIRSNKLHGKGKLKLSQNKANLIADLKEYGHWSDEEIVDIRDDIFVEPSAGDGSFSDYFLEHECIIDAYDIDPKKEYIMKQNFLQLDIEKYKSNKKRIHSIGNPPFGRQSSLAKKFIKKCALFSDTISFILPKSFRKESYKSAFPLNFHLVEEYELTQNAFTIDGQMHNVPCVFQVWIKKNEHRYIEPKQIERGFQFVKKPLVKDIEIGENGIPINRKNIFTENPDFGILRAGGGDTCGRISVQWEDGIACYPEAWLFIKLDHKYDKDKFYEEYKKIDWKDDSNVGARSISKPIFIKGINKLLQTMD